MGLLSFSKSSKGRHRDHHHGSDYYKRRHKSGLLGSILGAIFKRYSHSSNSHSKHRRRHKSSWS